MKTEELAALLLVAVIQHGGLSAANANDLGDEFGEAIIQDCWRLVDEFKKQALQRKEQRA